MSITFQQSGNLSKTFQFLEKVKGIAHSSVFDECGRKGVEALAEATPKRTGKTAASWSYEIERQGDSVSVVWKNSNIVGDYNIAILLQYGHGTGTGGYVVGIDYINPALKPVFEEMKEKLWKEVSG